MKLTYLSLPDDRDGNPQYLLVLSECDEHTAGDINLQSGKHISDVLKGCVGALAFTVPVEVTP